MSDTPSHPDLLRLAAVIISAHASRNKVTPEALPDIIRSVYAALNNAGSAEPVVAAKPEPAVPVKKSVFPGYLVCLEDGKQMKMLKRHLQVSYGMTPQDYRQKWGLPDSYPMVAPDYAAHRSAVAKKLGLGRKAAAPEESAPLAVNRVPEGVSGKRARKAAD